MMYWYGDGMGWWGPLFMSLIMLLFWALVVAALVVLIRSAVRGGQRSGTPSSAHPRPEQVLAERFARGEIDAEEYRQRLEALRTGGRPLAKS